MKSIYQYNSSACNGPVPAPSHLQHESVALPGVTGTGYKHEQNPTQSQYSNLVFKCSLFIPLTFIFK